MCLRLILPSLWVCVVCAISHTRAGALSSVTAKESSLRWIALDCFGGYSYSSDDRHFPMAAEREKARDSRPSALHYLILERFDVFTVCNTAHAVAAFSCRPLHQLPTRERSHHQPSDCSSGRDATLFFQEQEGRRIPPLGKQPRLTSLNWRHGGANDLVRGLGGGKVCRRTEEQGLPQFNRLQLDSSGSRENMGKSLDLVVN
jgi:hypothetical protein